MHQLSGYLLAAYNGAGIIVLCPGHGESGINETCIYELRAYSIHHLRTTFSRFFIVYILVYRHLLNIVDGESVPVSAVLLHRYS